MDYEKKYKEAIELMKDCIPDADGLVHVRPQDIFPELIESEGEKIREDIVTYLVQSANSATLKVNAQKFNKWIAWLEKQGEQKSVFETKTPEESLGIDADTYNKVVDECIYGEQNHTCGEEDELSCFESALFTAFSDAWQSYLLGEKVNVKQWVKEHSKELLEAAKEELKEHKSSWSEEDEKFLDGIIANLEYLIDRANTYTLKQSFQKRIDWLKSLKERVQPQQEWADEHLSVVRTKELIRAEIQKQKQNLIDSIGHTSNKELNLAHHILCVLESFVNTIPEKSIEWTEDDENKVTLFMQLVEGCDNYEELANWLKSLRPQNTWKPSDLPHWKKSTLQKDNTTGFNSDYFCHKGYCINYKELFEKLPKYD